jgi:hypothetical protein
VKNRGRKKRRRSSREIVRVSRGRCQSRNVPHHAAANSTLPSKADAKRRSCPCQKCTLQDGSLAMLRCEHGRANAPFLSLMGTYRMSLRTVLQAVGGGHE